MGAPPSDVKDAALLSVNEKYYPKEHGAEWQSIIGINEFSGYSTGSTLAANVISSSIREGDPTVLDVVYKVTSKKSKVKVRVLAFEDGERSFAKVVRPETFIDGTAENVGDAVAPNVEHKISWKVSSDWATKLAKLKFEVLASEGEMLPLETMTIPASDQYGKMKITWNAISNRQAFDALLWLFADKDPGLSVTDGQVMDGEAIIAYETNASPYKKAKGAFMDEEGNYLGSECMYMAFKPATEYILEKMGYTILTGASLTYVNQETRLGLSPSGSRRYGYKIVE